ncbi:MAG: hypothetical protein ACI9W4_002299 [Rhodothermales bacterium]|jgi:uncharacterized protein YyaL (SSP411 family)
MNRLQAARSPYLLQHKNNPVDWFPWGEDAFAEAAKRDVPVFLSIGYATCHWCHVMEHESFEDAEVAALMNQHMVAIKVDREERPDIDDVYMAVCHLMGKQGGWPLTILMTPDRKPFYAGTYLPKHSRFGRIGMMDLVPRIAAMWRDERADIVGSADEITQVLINQSAPVTGASRSVDFSQDWLSNASRELASRYDATHGGFGSAPKFPAPQNLSLLFRKASAGVRPAEADMARDTILSMWRGGVYDQVGYGWHRYSTDSEWRLPHFEKMLHDQATMLDACVDGFLSTGDARLKEAGLQTAEYVMRDLTHEEGGFYSAEDADSEGEEGLFYVWTTDELRSLLSAQDAAIATAWFGMEDAGNFLDEATRERTGTNVMHPGDRSAEPPEELPRIQAALLAARAPRVRPLRDEKVLADWNGLMIGALARAGRAFEAPALVEAAERAHVFVRTRLKIESGWLHRWFEGDAAVPAMLDDYAYLGGGLLELFQATSNPVCLRDALELADDMMAYCDAPDGGFYRGSTKGEALLVRKQDWYDGAMPAGVSKAVGLLLGLGALTSEARYTERAAQLLAPASAVLNASPSALSGFLSAAASLWAGGREIIVVAARASDPLVEEARRQPRGGDVFFWLPTSGADRDALEALIPAVAPMTAKGGATAYVCRDFVCEQPLTDAKSLRATLGGTEA